MVALRARCALVTVVDHVTDKVEELCRHKELEWFCIDLLVCEIIIRLDLLV